MKAMIKDAIEIYIEDNNPEELKELKQSGKLEEHLEAKSDQMISEIEILTNQLRAKDGGQARMLAQEMVMSRHLPR